MKMITTTMITEAISAISTSWIAPLMKLASSLVTVTSTPGGNVFFRLATAARMPSEISSVFDCA
ncbi:hypothetical protein D3C71_2131770 [compost metagenome]